MRCPARCNTKYIAKANDAAQLHTVRTHCNHGNQVVDAIQWVQQATAGNGVCICADIKKQAGYENDR